MFFVWDDRNRLHIAEHGVESIEAEQVVRGAKRPYPRRLSRDKLQVKGQTRAGRWLQVIYVHRPAETIDIAELTQLERIELMERGEALYVIHARDLRRGER